jgi:RimJ/RimL family protein N-acetyltransferase
VVLKKAELKDSEAIMQIIKEAQHHLREKGIDQWQNNYPNKEIVEEDIARGINYILLKDDIIIGTVVLTFAGEETYKRIYKGQWLCNQDYAVVHRIAVARAFMGQGYGSIILKELEKLCLEKGFYCIRVDTHEENRAMQKLLENRGFHYCGIIYLKDGAKRLAFEKHLKKA